MDHGDEVAARVEALDDWAVSAGIEAAALRVIVRRLLAERFADLSPEEAAALGYELSNPYRPIRVEHEDISADSQINAAHRLVEQIDAIVADAAEHAAKLRASRR